MPRSGFTPSRTASSDRVQTERDAYTRALDHVHGFLYPGAKDLAALDAARTAYLDALRPHTSRALHAAECLRTGGVLAFLHALPGLTDGQVTMLLKNWTWTMPPDGPVAYLLFVAGLEASGRVDVVHQTPLQMVLGNPEQFPPETLATALFLVPPHGTTRNAILAALQSAGWSAHAITDWAKGATRTPTHQQA